MKVAIEFASGSQLMPNWVEKNPLNGLCQYDHVAIVLSKSTALGTKKTTSLCTMTVHLDFKRFERSHYTSRKKPYPLT